MELREESHATQDAVPGHTLTLPKFHFVVGKHADGFPPGAGLCGSRWHLQR